MSEIRIKDRHKNAVPFHPNSLETSIGCEFVVVSEYGEGELTTWDRSPPGHGRAGRES
jgi:hypothetical protein